MHEASLMKNLMRQLEDIVKTENAKRVTGVSVWLGALSRMSAAHFAEHFEESSAGTLAEGAEVDVTVSDDPEDANAEQILIRSVTVDT